MIDAKYGSPSLSARPMVVKQSYGVSLWKGIMATFDIFWNHIKIEVGMGENVSFWDDIWLGNEKLSTKFPNLFSLILDKEASVASYSLLITDGRFKLIEEILAALLMLKGVIFWNSLVTHD